MKKGARERERDRAIGEERTRVREREIWRERRRERRE